MEWRSRHPKRRRIEPELVVDVDTVSRQMTSVSVSPNSKSTVTTSSDSKSTVRTSSDSVSPDSKSSDSKSSDSVSSDSKSGLTKKCIINHSKNRRKRRRVVPEWIGVVSTESKANQQELRQYFNADHNSMFNEQNFAKYTAMSNEVKYHRDRYQYRTMNLEPVHHEHSMPLMVRKKKEDESNEESDISIASNPDDPLSIRSYRRKMVKITDYFPLIKGAKAAKLVGNAK